MPLNRPLRGCIARSFPKGFYDPRKQVAVSVSGADGSNSELRSSRQQQQLPGGPPPFKIPVRLLHLRQRIHMFDPQLELAVANHAEDRRGTLLHFLRADGVM